MSLCSIELLVILWILTKQAHYPSTRDRLCYVVLLLATSRNLLCTIFNNKPSLSYPHPQSPSAPTDTAQYLLQHHTRPRTSDTAAGETHIPSPHLKHTTFCARAARPVYRVSVPAYPPLPPPKVVVDGPSLWQVVVELSPRAASFECIRMAFVISCSG